jgi:hypothetical protein
MEHFEERDDCLEMLLAEAEQGGDPTEMTAQDWDDIEREGLAILRSKMVSRYEKNSQPPINAD